MSYSSDYSSVEPRIMSTHFITVEIDLQATPAHLHSKIEAELKKQGEPLRWAVTNVNIERQLAVVEAIVTLESDVWAARV